MSQLGNRLPRKAQATGKPGNRVHSESLERAQAQTVTSALRTEAASQAQAIEEGFTSRDAILTEYGARLDDLENPAP